MDQDATWYGGRPRPGDNVLYSDPAPPHEMRHSSPSHFSAHVYCRKRSPISITAELLYNAVTLIAKLHYAIWSQTGPRLVADLLARASSELDDKPNSSSLQVCDQLRTCLRPDSVMEFGFKSAKWLTSLLLLLRRQPLLPIQQQLLLLIYDTTENV